MRASDSVGQGVQVRDHKIGLVIPPRLTIAVDEHGRHPRCTTGTHIVDIVPDHDRIARWAAPGAQQVQDARRGRLRGSALSAQDPRIGEGIGQPNAGEGQPGDRDRVARQDAAAGPPGDQGMHQGESIGLGSRVFGEVALPPVQPRPSVLSTGLRPALNFPENVAIVGNPEGIARRQEVMYRDGERAIQIEDPVGAGVQRHAPP